VRGLDEILPTLDRHEAHAIDVDADPATAVAAFLAAPSAPGRLVGALLRLRGVRRSPTIESLLTTIGFAVLRRTPTEVVVGAAGRPWTARGGMRAFADARAGDVRVAVDVRAVRREGGGCTLSTETRIQATDAASRKAFGRYWRLVGPFSALIRRRWLRAAAHAVNTAPTRRSEERL
jgi:hypothetical protein